MRAFCLSEFLGILISIVRGDPGGNLLGNQPLAVLAQQLNFASGGGVNLGRLCIKIFGDGILPMSDRGFSWRLAF